MTKNPGMGAMIHLLSGGSKKSASDYYGRRIRHARLEEERLLIAFEDGVTIALTDEGQSCCEARYMRSDDDIASLIGGTLAAMTVKEGPDEVGEYGDTHETCFVEVQTDKGFITIASHNEHNGYYGGFAMSIDEVES